MEFKRKSEDVTTGSTKLRCKRTASIRNCVKERVKVINDYWISDRSLHSDFDVHVDTSPFKHCVVENFLHDTEYLKELKEELLDLEFVKKQNDLYQFHQSCDLSVINKPLINSLKQFLVEECCAWLEMATNIKLNKKVSVTCSSYNYSDHLLCHDDKCEDRRIAFILYLSEHWLPDYGGCLELFNTDDNGHPKEVVKTIRPVFNTLVFFEVMCKSFHQVAEVGVIDRTRLSVNGWFHGPLPECRYIVPNVNIDVLRFSPIQDDGSLVRHVNSMYFDPEIQEQISVSFEQDSEILLPDFLDKDFYEEICNCLRSDDFSWELQGPPNRRKYETPHEKILPLPLTKLVQLLKSEQFFKLLGDLTKLELTSSQNNAQGIGIPQCSYEVQRWQKGFYTLLCDDHVRNEYALDVIIHFNIHNVKQLQGGFVSYVARDADEEFVVLDSVDNSNKRIIIANTHQYFHPDADHIRLLQSSMTLTYLEHLLAETVAENPDHDVSCIFCGDFNSTPEWGVYRLITTQYIPVDCIDWASNKDEEIKDVSLSHSLLLASAYGTPEFTNFTEGFAGCLDYIFYQHDKLNITQVVPLPSTEELQQHVALPSVVFPSDHIALVADLSWKQV